MQRGWLITPRHAGAQGWPPPPQPPCSRPWPCAQVDNAKLEAAHHLLKPFCLRRLKEEVERGMPPKVGQSYLP